MTGDLDRRGVEEGVPTAGEAEDVGLEGAAAAPKVTGDFEATTGLVEDETVGVFFKCDCE